MNAILLNALLQNSILVIELLPALATQWLDYVAINFKPRLMVVRNFVGGVRAKTFFNAQKPASKRSKQLILKYLLRALNLRLLAGIAAHGLKFIRTF